LCSLMTWAFVKLSFIPLQPYHIFLFSLIIVVQINCPFFYFWNLCYAPSLGSSYRLKTLPRVYCTTLMTCLTTPTFFRTQF
jgi:hypothetical protein